MKRIFLFLLIFCPILTQAAMPDTIYFDSDWKKVSTADSAKYFRSTVKQLEDSHYLIEDRYLSNGNLQMTGFFNDSEAKVEDGYVFYYYENGKMQSEEYYTNGSANGLWQNYARDSSGILMWKATYNDGFYHGDVIFYHRNSKVLRKEVYEYGRFKIGWCYTPTGADTPYYPDRSVPRFPYGDNYYQQYVDKRLKYPRHCWKNRIEGRVYVTAYFDEKGKIYKTEISKSVHPLLDEEALRIINSMPSLEPALTDEGIPRKATRELDILFEK